MSTNEDLSGTTQAIIRAFWRAPLGELLDHDGQPFSDATDTVLALDATLRSGQIDAIREVALWAIAEAAATPPPSGVAAGAGGGES